MITRTPFSRLLSMVLCLCMVLSLLPAIPQVTAEAATEYMTIYFRNDWNWSDIRLYYWGSKSASTPTWPGITMTYYGASGGKNYYYAKVPTDVTGIIVNGNNGSKRDQSPDITSGWYDGITYYMFWNNGNQVKNFNIRDVFACKHTTTTTVAGYAATCTKDGLTDGKKCTECGEMVTAQQVIPAAHSFQDGICGVCGAEQYMDIYFRNDWNWSDINLYFWGSKTDTNPAWPGNPMTFYDNDGDHNYFVVTVPTDVTGIVINGTKDDGSGTTDQSPDIKSGWYDGITYYMHWDGGNQVGNINIADVNFPCKHKNQETVSGYDATCTDTGLTDGVKCSDCDEMITPQKVISALGHSYDAVVTDPDCVNGGYTTYTCSTCGDSYVADYVDELGHTLSCADNGDGTHNVVCDICTTTVETNVECTYDAETHICDCGAVEKFTVIFQDEDGTVLSEQTVPYGEMPELPEDPSKAPDAYYTYYFDVWSPEVEAVTGDATYTATYIEMGNRYFVTFMVDGEQLAKIAYRYGSELPWDYFYQTHGVPEKEGYTFIGWVDADGNDCPDTMPAYDLTIYADWEINTYTITWIVDDVPYDETYEYGQIPVFTGSTDKAADGCTVYTFAGWDQELAPITGGMTYVAVYTESIVHSWVDATCTAPKTCGVCGATEGEPLDHTDDDNSGRCDSCQILMQPAKICFATASLEGKIAINFYTLLSDEVAADPNAYMQFTVANGETPQILQVPASAAVSGVLNGETYYMFTYAVNAKEMADDVICQLFYEGGSTAEVSYNVKAYGNYIVENNDNASAKALAQAMLNYGAASQIHFGYNTDNLANSQVATPDYSQVTISGFNAVAGQGTELATLYSASLILKSETTLRFFFKVDGSVESFTVTYNGQELEVNQRSGLYYVDVAGIAAKDLDEAVTVTINDGTTTADVSFNPMSYCQGVLNDNSGAFDQEMKDLVAALYLYNQAANEYF